MHGNVRPNQNTVTQKEVMMKLHCSFKSIHTDGINYSQFQRELWVERTCKSDRHEWRCAQFDVYITTNKLQESSDSTGIEGLVSKETVVPASVGK